jgi:hypothetical protein
MTAPRVDVSGAALADGRVLITGGDHLITGFNRSTGVLDLSGPLASAELYDPDTGSFAATGAATTPSSTLFGASRRLDGDAWVTTAATGEIFTAATGSFSSLGALPTTITGAGAFTFTLATGDAFALPALALSDALAGKSVGGPVLINATTHQITKPASATIGSTSAAIATATGDVLIVGGQRAGAATAQTQVFRAATATWDAPGATTVVRHGPVLANLADGTVLVMGGCQTNACGATVVRTAERCNSLPANPSLSVRRSAER